MRPASPALAGGFLPLSHQGSPLKVWLGFVVRKWLEPQLVYSQGNQEHQRVLTKMVTFGFEFQQRDWGCRERHLDMQLYH